MAGYHKKNASTYESICNRDFGDIKAGSEAALEGFVMNLNGPDTKNVYQSYNFGFTLGFQLEQTDVEQYYYDGAVSITKNVTENGQPYQVNTTFYACLLYTSCNWHSVRQRLQVQQIRQWYSTSRLQNRLFHRDHFWPKYTSVSYTHLAPEKKRWTGCGQKVKRLGSSS